MHRKEPKAGNVQAVKVAVRVGHQLAALFRGRVWRHREINQIGFTEDL